MQGRLFMQGTDGNTTSLALTSIPEFIPPEPTEEEEKKLITVWGKSMTCEFSCKISYMSPRTRKWWICLSRFGNWTAKGHIRMRMLKKAAMQEKSFVRTYHVVQDENGRFWYRRGDGAVVELIVDEDTRRLYDGQ